MKLVVVKARIFWGYSIKQPTQTAAQDSIPLPPPTTVLGAIAAPYAKYFKLPETLKIGGNTYSTTAKLLIDDLIKYCSAGLLESTAVKYSDTSRSIMLIYQKHKERKYHFAAQAVGKVYTPSWKENLLLVYIVDDKYSELISKISWGIISLGSKEGIVSVCDVITSDVKKLEVRNQLVKTPFITPSRIAFCEAGCAEIKLCRISPDSYLSGSVCVEEDYLVPIHPDVRDLYGGLMRVRPNDKAAVVEVPLGDGVKTYILVPEGVIS
ncbi:MAG: type I-A CRISPR-associated protein Cas5a [Sulfolobales archaeon]